jgi:hypothetical protein
MISSRANTDRNNQYGPVLLGGREETPDFFQYRGFHGNASPMTRFAI